MKEILSLARSTVLNMAPYSSARSLGLTGDIFLDANENPWPPFPGDETAVGLNRYPEPQPKALVARLAELYNVPEKNLIVGRGADESIDSLVRAFCEANRDAILICPPTYGMYEVSANLQGARIVRVPTSEAQGFQVDAEAVLAAWTPEVKLVFLCTPNNPTGNTIDFLTIQNLATALLGKSLLVLDEAYIEFAGDPSLSFVSRLPDFPNVVVLRTLSKAYGLAGARCGVAIGHPALIDLLQKVRAPYPMSVPATRAVLAALSPEGGALSKKRVAALIQNRQALSDALSASRKVEKVFPSKGNFLLIRTSRGKQWMGACLRAGVVVRDRSREPGLEHCVRISVGTDVEIERLLQALEENRND